MLERTLRNRIPSVVSSFAKLSAGGQPYDFDHWDNGILYYRVSRNSKGDWNKKRVIISEVHAALAHLAKTGSFSRKDFQKLCPTTGGDGECGFCVIGRVLEVLSVAMYAGWGEGFVLIDVEKARTLLTA